MNATRINGHDAPLYYSTGILAPDHFTIQVQPEMMTMALGLFVQLGWCELVHRRQSHLHREISFVRTTVGDYPDIQLIELKSEEPSIVLPTVHLGFKMCPPNTPKWMVNVLMAWANEQKTRFEAQEVNAGEWLICFPDIFATRFELVP